MAFKAPPMRAIREFLVPTSSSIDSHSASCRHEDGAHVRPGSYPSASAYLARRVSLAVTVCTLLLGGLGIGLEYYGFLRNREHVQESTHQAEERRLMNMVAHVQQTIAYHRSRVEQLARDEVRSQVEQAVILVESLAAGRPADPLLPSLAASALRSLSVNSGAGYFFAFDMQGINRAYPPNPGLEGASLLHVTDTQGRPILAEMISIVRDKGEGFSEYDWEYPGRPDGDHKKVAFVKYAPSLKWGIGAGVYLEDITERVKEAVLDELSHFAADADEYVFAGTVDGVALLEPARGRNMIDVRDVNGVPIVRNLIAAAKSGGGFVRYVLPQFEGKRTIDKLSYAVAVPDWGWYVGAGTSSQRIQQTSHDATAAFRGRMMDMVMALAAVTVVLLAASFVVVRRSFGPLRQQFRAIETFFGTAAEGSAVLSEPRPMCFREFEALAASARRMVEKRFAAERTMLEAEAQFRQYFDHAPDGIFISDDQGRYLDVNPAGCELVGYGRTELLGMTLYDVTDPDYVEETRRRTRTMLEKGQASGEYALRRKDGEKIFVLISAVRLAVNRNMCFCKDLTERHRAEEALYAAKEQAEAANAAKSLFLTNMSHELRTPLNGINGFAEMMLLQMWGPLEARYLEYARLIHQSGQHLLAVICDILDMSRIEAGRIDLVIEPTDIQSILEECVDLVRGQANEKSLPVDLQATEAPPALVDRLRTKQIVLNILSNAVKFSDRGRIAVSNSYDGRNHCIAIADQGIGMTEEEIEIALKPFGQVEQQPYTRRAHGTGLGLPIAKQLTEHQGGTLEIASRPSGGTTVTIRLPGESR